ncbi:MAG: YqeG family HAD IIIA-type phosphatase [bacterium]
MIHLFLPKKKFFPHEYVQSIYDVDYNKLYAEGFRLILTDLDNTLISYKESVPNEKLFEWKKQMEEIGFKIIVVSNSGKARVKHFSDLFGVEYVSSATKPLKRGYKKGLKKTEFKKEEVIFFGDQLMTDIYGANRFGVAGILVQAIDKKTERFITKVNRFNEKRVLRSIKRKFPDKFKERLEEYYEKHF